MIIPILLLVLTVQQLAHSETANHCHTHRKINAADLVRTINQSPESTWKVRNILDLSIECQSKYDFPNFNTFRFDREKRRIEEFFYFIQLIYLIFFTGKLVIFFSFRRALTDSKKWI